MDDDEQIPSALLNAYLRGAGWVLLTQDDRWARFSRPMGKERKLVTLRVPLQHDAVDYDLRVSELLQNLQRLEDRPMAYLLRDVRTALIDLVRIKLRGVDKGRISVAHGSIAFEKTRDLFLAAACAAHKPRPFYPKAKIKRVKAYLDSAKFGPTEAGSFVVTVESPVTPELNAPTKENPQSELALGEIPFGRRVSTTLARATSAVRTAVDYVSTDGEDGRLIETVSEGVTANLCEALSGLLKISGGQNAIDLAFRFASSRKVDESIPRRVIFDENAANYLPTFSKRLRAASLEKRSRVAGYVEALRSKDPTEGGDVTIKLIEPSRLNEKMMHFELPSSDYGKAMEAHRTHQLLVCDGDIFRDAHYELVNIKRVWIVPLGQVHTVREG
jgi:hypothetical protein